MNISDILIGLGVLLIVFAAGRAAWKNRGKCSCGTGACGGACSGCPGCKGRQGR